MAPKKARKSSAKQKLKLRKKPLADLTAKETSAASVKGGSLAATKPTFAPPYVPAGPVVSGDNI